MTILKTLILFRRNNREFLYIFCPRKKIIRVKITVSTLRKKNIVNPYDSLFYMVELIRENECNHSNRYTVWQQNVSYYVNDLLFISDTAGSS